MSAPPASEDTFGIRAVSMLSVISARKVDFAENVMHRLHDSSRPKLADSSGRGRWNEFRKGLVQLVAELDWRLFVTSSELEKRTLNLSTKLEDLDRQAIWMELEKRLAKKLGIN